MTARLIGHDRTQQRESSLRSGITPPSSVAKQQNALALARLANLSGATRLRGLRLVHAHSCALSGFFAASLCGSTFARQEQEQQDNSRLLRRDAAQLWCANKRKRLLRRPTTDHSALTRQQETTMAGQLERLDETSSQRRR